MTPNEAKWAESHRLPTYTQRSPIPGDPGTVRLAKYTGPGSYPLLYLSGEDGVLCRDCAEESLDDFIVKFRPVAYDANWNDPTLFCDCGERIESAYAEPEEEPTE